MENTRRQQAENELGLDFAKEDKKRELALAKEQERVALKEAKRKELMQQPKYRLMDKTAKWMDKYFLDPIIGLILPGIGDTLSSVLAFPYIYYSLFKIKSIPLTLAVIFNILKDILLGSIPFYIGDFIDFFNRSYVANLRLITGFINDDKEIISQVNRKAIWTAIGIFLICFAIYGVIKLALWITATVFGWGADLFHFITSLF